MRAIIDVASIIGRIDVKRLSILILWVFHITAIIGITVGFFDFFIPKTPLNLLIALILLLLNFKINTTKTVVLLILFFCSGMLVEWVGVHNDILFGAYSYGANLGWKVDNVPLLIGVNWAILVFITGAIANRFAIKRWLKIIFGAFLMVVLDFMMEVSAPKFDFWTFEGGYAPVQNFITWFGVALLLHFIFQKTKVVGDAIFSGHLYACQFVFFAYFAAYYSW